MKHVKEVVDEVMEWREDLISLCKVEDGHLILNDGVSGYPIKLDRCDTHEKIVWWVSHLIPKKWITKDHLRMFILHACEQAGIPAHGHI